VHKPASFLALKVQAVAGHPLALLFGRVSGCPIANSLAVSMLTTTTTGKNDTKRMKFPCRPLQIISRGKQETSFC
jgi:hypothetical protein